MYFSWYNSLPLKKKKKSLIVTVFVLINDPLQHNMPYIAGSLSLSLSDWPRSKVMADAVSTSWVSFRSPPGIHLHYKQKPRVSAEPREQTCQTASSLFAHVWMAECRCSVARVDDFVMQRSMCVGEQDVDIRVICCDSSGLKLTMGEWKCILYGLRTWTHVRISKQTDKQFK